MIAASFLLGALIGVAAMIVLALWLAQRDKPKKVKQRPAVALTAIGMSLNGNNPDESYPATLQRVFRDFENQTKH
jgi:hypothetical protein